MTARRFAWAAWSLETFELYQGLAASLRADLAARPAPWLRRAIRSGLRMCARQPIRLARLAAELAERERLRERGPTVTKPERPRCGARCRSKGGAPCKAPAVWDHERNRARNGRCRMHGGLSTGARTPEGRERARLAPMEARERRASW